MFFDDNESQNESGWRGSVILIARHCRTTGKGTRYVSDEASLSVGSRISPGLIGQLARS
jgi:hypothetical protein